MCYRPLCFALDDKFVFRVNNLGRMVVVVL